MSALRNSLASLKLLHFSRWQGEKGEPGVTIAADGSIISAPRGLQGPKGPKVPNTWASQRKQCFRQAGGVVEEKCVTTIFTRLFYPFLLPQPNCRVTAGSQDQLDSWWVPLRGHNTVPHRERPCVCLPRLGPDIYRVILCFLQGPIGPTGHKGEYGFPGRPVSICQSHDTTGSAPKVLTRLAEGRRAYREKDGAGFELPTSATLSFVLTCEATLSWINAKDTLRINVELYWTWNSTRSKFQVCKVLFLFCFLVCFYLWKRWTQKKTAGTIENDFHWSDSSIFCVQGRPGMAGRKGDKGDSVGVTVRSEGSRWIQWSSAQLSVGYSCSYTVSLYSVAEPGCCLVVDTLLPIHCPEASFWILAWNHTLSPTPFLRGLQVRQGHQVHQELQEGCWGCLE